MRLQRLDEVAGLGKDGFMVTSDGSPARNRSAKSKDMARCERQSHEEYPDTRSQAPGGRRGRSSMDRANSAGDLI